MDKSFFRHKDLQGLWRECCCSLSPNALSALKRFGSAAANQSDGTDTERSVGMRF